jgi:hypothetical protein
MSYIDRRGFNKNMDTLARRIYFRDFSDMPPELFGTKMEKESYLNALTKETLSVNGVQPYHG